jgi:peptide chain release factor 1
MGTFFSMLLQNTIWVLQYDDEMRFFLLKMAAIAKCWGMEKGFQEKLGGLVARYDELGRMMANPDALENYSAVSKEFSSLQPIVILVKEYEEATKEVTELEQLLSDPDMKQMAEDDLAALQKLLPKLAHEIQVALLPRDEADEKNAIIEVRAGTGGDEAGLFAAELFRMYQRYAENHGWKFETMEISETGVGGYKEAIGAIKGKGVFARLKFESGVHRVQRVPVTESGGRIHTSAATVAILPEAEEVDIEVREQDIRIDTMRASGAGGQHVNTTDSAVRITHLPTGIMVTSSEKSQHQNRARAMQVLRARLYDMQRQKLDNERAASRKGQVGSGDRSERIRTYNFPQGRITDHRINKTAYSLQDFMEGGKDLDAFIDELRAVDEAERLSAVAEEFS